MYVEPGLRRKRKEDNNFLLKVMFIVWVGAFCTWLYVLTPTVHGEETMHYQDVHSKEQACAYKAQHKYAVIKGLKCI